MFYFQIIVMPRYQNVRTLGSETTNVNVTVLLDFPDLYVRLSSQTQVKVIPNSIKTVLL